MPSQPLMLVGDSLAQNKSILVGHTIIQAPEQHHLPPLPNVWNLPWWEEWKQNELGFLMLTKGHETNKQETNPQKQIWKNHDACNWHLTLVANLSTKKMTWWSPPNRTYLILDTRNAHIFHLSLSLSISALLPHPTPPYYKNRNKWIS